EIRSISAMIGTTIPAQERKTSMAGYRSGLSGGIPIDYAASRINDRCDPDYSQRSATELNDRRFPITPLQVAQDQRPVLRGPGLPHYLPSVHGLFLARRLSSSPIREQVVHGEWFGMGHVSIQRMH